jgi:hypothetical protein
MESTEAAVAKLRAMLAKNPLMPEDEYRKVLQRIYELGG